MIVNAGISSINMDSFGFFFSGLQSASITGTQTPTNWTASTGNTLFTFVGSSFGTLAGLVPTTGTINELTWSVAGQTMASITGSVDWNPLYVAINASNWTNFVTTMFGGADTLNGSNASGFGDALVGFGGADLIYGNGGNDTLYGDEGMSPLMVPPVAGNDTLFGGIGDDTLFGGGADDSLEGGDGNDRLDGGVGNDVMEGGIGDDSLTSNSGTDIVSGGVGLDTLFMDRSTSAVAYAINAASMRSDTGITLSDGTIIRSIERFDVKLGTAADSFTVNTPPIGSFSTNAVDGGAGSAVDIANLDYSWSSGPVDFGVLAGGPSDIALRASTSFGTHTTIISGFERFFVTGSGVGDTIFTADGNDVVSSGDGDDFVSAAGGDDLVNGGTGNDRLTAGAGNDTLNGEAGDDTITYTSGIDVIDGGAGFDALSIDLRSSTVGINLGGALLRAPGGWTLANGTTILNMETLGEVQLGSGNDTLTVESSLQTNSYFQSEGGAGTDYLILDLSSSALQRNVANETFRLRDGGTYYNGFELLDIRGGSAGDDLSGMDNADTITGNNGDDRIRGFGGNDVLYGGAGNDTLAGMLGNDLVFGDAGDDVLELSTNGGVDTVDGGAGVDLLTLNLGLSTTNIVLDVATMSTQTGVTLADGTVIRNIEGFQDLTLGSGNDSITVGNVPSTLARFNGGSGMDTFTVDLTNAAASPIDPNTFAANGQANGYNIALYEFGFTSFEVFKFIGSAFGDRIFGTAANDTIQGGQGNDTIYYNGGSDAIFGEDGADMLLYADVFSFSGNYAVTMDGGTGSDLASFDLALMLTGVVLDSAVIAGSTGMTLANGATFRNIEQFGKVVFGTGDDELIIRNAHLLNSNFVGVSTPASAGRFIGGAGFDKVTLDYSALNSGGLSVNDLGFGFRIIGGGVTTLVDAFEAITVIATQFQDGMSGTANGDRFEGLGGNDILDGRLGNDTLLGGAGADTLIGSGGDDFLDGQADDDVLDGGDGNDIFAGGTGTNLFYGGLGFDVAILTGLTQSYYIDMALWFPGGPLIVMGDNSLSSIEGISLGDGNDTMVGTATKDWLGGGGGADFLTADAGNDTVIGGHGSDIVILGAGNDTGYGGLSHYDAQTAGSASDVDYVYAGDGDDFIGNGGAGLDVLLGEAGNDTINDADGTFTYLFGGTGVNVMSSNSGVSVFLSEGSTDTMSSNSGSAFYYRLANGASNVTGGAGVDQFIGGAALSNDNVIGAGGNDYLYGGDGNDLLSGGAGNDVIIGQVGNDTLDGGAGVNLLWANDAGNDQIRVNVAEGGTQVLEFFEAGGTNDVVRLLGASLTSFAGIEALRTGIGSVIGGNLLVNAGSGAQLYLNVGANQTAIWFQGVSAYSLTSGDFLFG
jgi:Ca2+-binding RTX toxin-like protein